MLDENWAPDRLSDTHLEGSLSKLSSNTPPVEEIFLESILRVPMLPSSSKVGAMLNYSNSISKVPDVSSSTVAVSKSIPSVQLSYSLTLSSLKLSIGLWIFPTLPLSIGPGSTTVAKSLFSPSDLQEKPSKHYSSGYWKTSSLALNWKSKQSAKSK